MLAAVHGVFDRFISTLMTPWLVLNVSTWKPERGTLICGIPTSLTPGGSDGDAPGLALGSLAAELIHLQSLGVGVAFAAVWLGFPPVEATMIQATAAMTTIPATPAPMRACRR